MRYIKIPVIFDANSDKDRERFKEMGLKLDEELDVEFGYLNTDKIMYFWEGEILERMTIM